MIRANLLPRPKATVGFAGLELDADYLRQLLLGLLIVITVAVIGVGIERLRVHRLEVAAGIEDDLIASHTRQRGEAKALALEVARYQGFAREAGAFRRSGADAAIAVAQIGNSVPKRVWLNSLERTTNGYDMTGGSYSVDALGGTILSLGHALAGNAASLVAIDNRNTALGGVKFSAHIGTPTTTVPALVPVATTLVTGTARAGTAP